MLIEFSVENFRSFKDRVTLSLEATKYDNKKLPNNHVTIGELDLLKSSVIFGPNASGKSNVINAMSIMRKIVEFSVQSGVKRNYAFLLDSDSSRKPTEFEIKFLAKDVIYKYGFKFEENLVVGEWLYCSKNISGSKESLMFLRELQKIEAHGKYKKESSLIIEANKTRKNALFLPTVAQFNGTISLQIMDWFAYLNAFSCLHDLNDYESYTIKRLKNREETEKIANFIKLADFGISSIEFNEITIDDLKKNKINLAKKFINDISEEQLSNIQTLHPKYDEQKEFLKFEKFDFKDESDGTQSFIKLAGAIFEVIENGEILVIDEFDSSFHPKMTEQLVKLFNSDRNTKNAQLIFTTHNTNLLSQKLFRRDQIWFTEKNNYGESSLFSLVDFGVRKDASLEKNYLNGKYGAIPYINELSI
jgi:AAA15 family ATPase/GTPase